ncbi:hypothetical protein QF047_002470 [Arthrobacter sp. W4I7]|nr:hypothetical protein [Arthrobacter sp. W4I7]
MQVDPPVPRDAECSRRNQPAVSHDRRDIRAGSGNPGHGVFVDPGSVNNLDPELGGPGGHRRRSEHALPSDWRVRPGKDRDNVESCFNERVEGRDGDGGGSREEDPHPLVPAAPPPKLDPEAAPPKLEPPKLEPTVLARFAVVCSVMES